VAELGLTTIYQAPTEMDVFAVSGPLMDKGKRVAIGSVCIAVAGLVMALIGKHSLALALLLPVLVGALAFLAPKKNGGSESNIRAIGWVHYQYRIRPILIKKLSQSLNISLMLCPMKIARRG
jgi:hypothetical protein